jgi:hypothetical protein
MDLLVKLVALKPTYTIGNMYIIHDNNNTEYFSDTLGDTYRDLLVEPKVPGKTHIPCGKYKFTLQYSPKHECLVPLLQDVPQFTMIEIHWGNTPEDTDGCIIVGKNTIKGKVTNSKNTFDRLMDILSDSGQKEWWITIEKG